jgi:hypothetical protein
MRNEAKRSAATGHWSPCTNKPRRRRCKKMSACDALWSCVWCAGRPDRQSKGKAAKWQEGTAHQFYSTYSLAARCITASFSFFPASTGGDRRRTSFTQHSSLIQLTQYSCALHNGFILSSLHLTILKVSARGRLPKHEYEGKNSSFRVPAFIFGWVRTYVYYVDTKTVKYIS